MDANRPGDELDPQALPPQHSLPPQPPLPPQARPPAEPPPHWQPQDYTPPAHGQVLVAIPGAVAVEGVVLTPAGFTPRFFAYLLDWVVLMILVRIFVMLAGIPEPDANEAMRAFQQFMRTMDYTLLESMGPPPWATFLTYAIYAAYYTLFHAYNGATLGKMALGLQVRRRDGQPLSIGLAFLRYVLYWATAWLAYTAWWIWVDRERRTAYDAVLKLNVFKAVGKTVV